MTAPTGREKWRDEPFDPVGGMFVPHGARALWAAADEEDLVDLPDHRLPEPVVAEMEWCVDHAESACEHVQTASAAGAASMVEKVVIRGVPALACTQPQCVADLVMHARTRKTPPLEDCVMCERLPTNRSFRAVFRDAPTALSLIAWCCEDCVHDRLPAWAGLR